MSLSSKDKARLYHELGTMLASGFHLDRTTELLLGQNPSASRRAWLEGLRKGLEEKLGVHEALKNHCAGLTSDLELGLIAAGERGGRLDEACTRLSEYFALRQQSVARAKGAMMYPLLLAHAGVLFPDLSQAMLGNGLGAAFSGIPQRLAVLWIILGGIALLAWFCLRAAHKSVAVDGVLRALPLTGAIRGHWALARFSQVMRTCLLAALRISDSLRFAGAATQSAVLENGANHAAEAVEAGSTFASALRGGGYPAQFTNAMEMAEQSGSLDVELGRWAKAETMLAAQSQERAAEWMPRIFYIAIVFYVGWRIVSTFSGYFSGLSRMLEQS